MTERENIAQQMQDGINPVSSPPPKRRRRSKKKKSNLKQYFEYFIWGAVIIGFIVTVLMFIGQLASKEKERNFEKSKKKASIENSGYIGTVA